MAKASENIRDALRRIDTPNKWCRGSYHVGLDRHCSAGALYMSGVDAYNDKAPEMEAVAHAFTEQFGAMPEDGFEFIIVHCNDRLAIHQDVVNDFEKAIAACEERGE